MSELWIYNLATMVFIAAAVIIFCVLFFMTAPYGRHAKSGWGTPINNRLGWVLMEAPASLLFILYACIGNRPVNITLMAMILIWQSHYLHRAFIYPFTIRGAHTMPLSIMLFGFLFNVGNTYIQGRWLFSFSNEGAYGIGWISDPRFWIGAVLFYTGFAVNRYADHVLRNLRKPGETGYKIPAGGMYRFISCPNYFGEILEWIGWAVLTWSLAGSVFAIWTAANLVPRAVSHHRWYRSTFPEYPRERRAVIPFIL
jgi:3-oxo-5-alpha-steroid 4-dehydrogenase 1